MATANSTLSLNHETIAGIRDALLIGLASYGEIERLSDLQEALTLRGKAIPEACRVIHPTGESDTVSRFADALRILCTPCTPA